MMCSTLVMGQAGFGKARLGGTVLDEKENPMVGVTVKIEFLKFTRIDETITNEKGQWSFSNLGSGDIKVIITVPGYLPETRMVTVSQVAPNPPMKSVLAVDPAVAIRAKAEAEMKQSIEALDMGNKLVSEGKLDEALTHFQDFAQNNPEVIIIHFNIGDVYRQKKEYDMAREHYQKVLDFAKERNDLVMQAKAIASFGDLALRQKNMQEAQKYFAESIALNPSDEILAYNVAEIYFGTNEVDKAIEYYQKAAQIKPSWSEPYMKIAYAYLNKGDIPNAIKGFEDFLKYEPEGTEQAAIARDLIKSLK